MSFAQSVYVRVAVLHETLAAQSIGRAFSYLGERRRPILRLAPR
jgi:hypothetical protein